MQLNNFILYCKGHYKKSDNIWEDVRKCIEADGYKPETKENILEIISNDLLSIIFKAYSYNSSLMYYISPKNTWETGYYTKQSNFPDKSSEYDFETAVLYFYMYKIRFTSITNFTYELPNADNKVLSIDK